MIFSKLNGLGNDFVITDDRENKYTENLDEMARKLCHRRTGIGADGLVFVRKSETCDVRMQIFNSDGSEAEMCGNGVRCFAKYVYDKGIFKHERMSVETLAGPMIIDREGRRCRCGEGGHGRSRNAQGVHTRSRHGRMPA